MCARTCVCSSRYEVKELTQAYATLCYDKLASQQATQHAVPHSHTETAEPNTCQAGISGKTTDASHKCDDASSSATEAPQVDDADSDAVSTIVSSDDELEWVYDEGECDMNEWVRVREGETEAQWRERLDTRLVYREHTRVSVTHTHTHAHTPT